MRDDSRPQDSFSWVRPWVPYGDDPFVWYDPAEDLKPLNPQTSEGRPAVRNETGPSPIPAVMGSADEVDIWVELPAIEDKPKKARRSRGRDRDRNDPATIAETVDTAEVEPEVVVVVSPEPEIAQEPVLATEEAPPSKPKRSRAKEVVADVVADVLTTEPQPKISVSGAAEPAPKVPDPNEISGPAPAPRKGWWRRG